MPDREFKVIVIKIIIVLERVEDISENLNKEIKKKNQSEIKNTINEIKNTLDGIKSRLKEAERISDLEDKVT